MRWLQLLGEILWPRGLKCLCCDSLSEGKLLCTTCEKALAAMRLSPEDAGKGTIRSVYRYEGVAKQLVRLLKEECLGAAADALAQDMAEQLHAMGLPKETILTWVTMPDRRRVIRGIDHGRVLCEAVAARTGRPVQQLLFRQGKVHTQRGLDRNARLKNLANSFGCKGSISVPVLLIDDVLTTGATVSACANELQKAGAPCVYALTATRVMLK